MKRGKGNEESMRSSARIAAEGSSVCGVPFVTAYMRFW
jgi:hypothetical protein